LRFSFFEFFLFLGRLGVHQVLQAAISQQQQQAQNNDPYNQQQLTTKNERKKTDSDIGISAAASSRKND